MHETVPNLNLSDVVYPSAPQLTREHALSYTKDAGVKRCFCPSSIRFSGGLPEERGSTFDPGIIYGEILNHDA